MKCSQSSTMLYELIASGDDWIRGLRLRNPFFGFYLIQAALNQAASQVSRAALDALTTPFSCHSLSRVNGCPCCLLLRFQVRDRLFCVKYGSTCCRVGGCERQSTVQEGAQWHPSCMCAAFESLLRSSTYEECVARAHTPAARNEKAEEEQQQAPKEAQKLHRLRLDDGMILAYG